MASRLSLLPFTGQPVPQLSKRFGNLPPELDVGKILKLYNGAKVEWNKWRSIHLELYDYLLPNRQQFVNDTPGTRKTDAVFNSAAVKATQRLAGRLQQTIVPAFRNWVRLEPGKQVPENIRPRAQAILDEQTAIMFEAINDSNFALAMHESLLDLVIGTGCLLVQDGGIDNPLEFASVPIFELMPVDGPNGTVETVFRDRPVRAGNVLQIWPQAQATLKPSDDLARTITEKPDKMLRFIEGVVHRPFFNDYVYVVLHQTDAAAAQSGSLQAAGTRVLVAAQMQENTFIVFRWSKLSGESYGRGPAFDVLPDVRTVNELIRFTLQNAQMAIAPPLLSTEQGILNPANYLYSPGGINVVGDIAGVGTLPNDYRFDVSNLLTDKLEESIRKGMFVDPLPPPESGIRSATEIMVRQQELAEDIGAAFGRLQAELLTKITQRVVTILQRYGKMAPFTLDGRIVDVKFTGPLAQSQERDDVLGFSQFWELSAAISPQVAMLGVRVEDVIEWLGDKFNIPQKLLRDEAEREQMQQQAAQTMFAQQQAGGDQGGPETGAIPPTR